VWVRGSAADRYRVAQWGGWGGLGLQLSARASTRTGMRAQERPGGRAIRVEWYHGGWRLGSPRWNAVSSTSVEGQIDERVGLYPFLGERVRVRGCTSAWMRVRVRVCARRGYGHGDGREHGGDTTTEKNKRRNRKGRMAIGVRARQRRLRHLHEKISQPSSKADITQCDGVAATRQGALR
jgi:hypothetical protein